MDGRTDGRGQRLMQPFTRRPQNNVYIAQSVRSLNVDRTNDFARSKEHRRRYLSHFRQMAYSAGGFSNRLPLFTARLNAIDPMRKILLFSTTYIVGGGNISM